MDFFVLRSCIFWNTRPIFIQFVLKCTEHKALSDGGFFKKTFIFEKSLVLACCVTYILERHLWVKNSKPFPFTPTWSLACKQTDCITAVCGNCLTVNTKHLYDFMQCWTSVEDVGPTLYKCHTNVLCLLDRRTFSQTLSIYPMLVQCWASVADVGLTLIQHWINVLFEWYLVISSVGIFMPSICTQ